MKDIQQLIKKNNQEGRYSDIFPKTYTDAVEDRGSGMILTDILAGFNMYFLPYVGSKKDTRLQVPEFLRRRGLIITYVTYDNVIVTERYKQEAIDDITWGDDNSWDNLWDTSDYIKANNAYGFNVTVFGINGGRHTIETAVLDVPPEIRVIGHKITFAQYDGTWATYQLQSMSLSDYTKPEKWVKLEGITNTGSIVITNQPDEEDITVDRENLLKFADKEYSESSFSGLGRVYLRKNIVDGKNVLTQEMLSKANTRYIIQYDYDLNGTTITIPENCVLEFDGGSLRNGTIVGNNTRIKSSIVEIFNKIIVSGSWEQEEVYSDWFDFSSEKYDNIINFSNLFILATSDRNTDVYINGKELYTSTNIPIEGSSVARRGIKIPSNVYIHNNATIKAIENDEERYSIFYVNDVENITIEGGELIGDVQTHTGSTGEWGYGIALGGAKNVVIKNITISECWGDGINVQALYTDYENKTTEGHCRNILIDNVKCLRNRRQGISIEGCFGITIRNSEFSDTGSIKSTNPGAGIDIEPWFEEEVVTDVLIENCKILNNQTYLQIYGKNDSRGVRINNCISDKGIWIRTSNVSIDNWICTGENYQAYLAIWGTCRNIKVTNSIFYNEVYCRGNVQDLLISNCEFDMKFTNPWSGFALYFENYNSTGIYKNIIISNNRFSDVYKSRFFYAASDDVIKIDFIGNEVVTTATFAQVLGYGDFIGNNILLKNCAGIVLNNKTGNTINVANNNIHCDIYTNYILEFVGNSIHSDSIEYDYKLYNNTITSKNSFRVFGGESVSDLYVDISSCNFGKDTTSELWHVPHINYNDGYELTSYFTKSVTPVIYNSSANTCYMFALPFKRGFVEFMTSNLNVTNSELFNTCTVVSLNPDTNSVEICPTKIYRNNVRVDSTSMNFVPEFGTKVDEDKIYIYIKYNTNVIFGLRITATVNLQEKIEYSDIKFSNSISIPDGDVIFYKKIDAISYSSTTNLSFNITPYLGWKIWNSNNKELAFDGSEWLNPDGTLESKVTII